MKPQSVKRTVGKLKQGGHMKSKIYTVIDKDGDGNVLIGHFRTNSKRKLLRHLQEVHAPNVSLRDIAWLYEISEARIENL